MKLLITLILALIFFQALAQDFTGTYQDEVGDTHTFTVQPDGTLLGKMNLSGTLVDITFEIEAGQATGVWQAPDGLVVGFVMTVGNTNTLNVQVVPFGPDDQPIVEQVKNAVLIRETVTAQHPLKVTEAVSNPLSKHTANPLGSSGIAIQANQTYNAGTLLVSSPAGFSLIVPAGNIAGYTVTERGQGALGIGDQKGSTLIVMGFSKADLLNLANLGLESLGNLELIPVGTPQQTSDMFRATFQADANGTPVAIHVAGKQGNAGNALVMLGYAMTGQDAGLREAVDSTLASVQFTQPTAQQPFSLGGIELKADSGSSTSNSSGDAHLSGIKEERYVFCSSGEYLYEMQDTTMFSGSLPGSDLSFSSEDSDQHQGRYEVVSGALGEPYLYLQAGDGRTFFHLLSENPNGVMVGEASFSVLQSTQCQ